MSWNTKDIPDLAGSVAVVTGANGGIGLESAKALAVAGAHVVMAARDQEKAKTAHDEIMAADPDVSLAMVPLDLGSLDSVRRGAGEILEAYSRVDILINNAGVMAIPERRSADGFEMQFAVNHLGHWVLTSRLLPALLSADAARVVTVTSTAHHFGRRVDPDNLNMEGAYEPWKAYGRSKLANYHFAIGLQREFAGRGLTAQSLVAHPGLTFTDLQIRAVEGGAAGAVGRVSLSMVKTLGMTPAKGTLPQLRAATDPGARGGEMYAPRFVNFGAPVRRPILRPGTDRAIQLLWELSESLTGEPLDVDAALAAVLQSSADDPEE